MSNKTPSRTSELQWLLKNILHVIGISSAFFSVIFVIVKSAIATEYPTVETPRDRLLAATDQLTQQAQTQLPSVSQLSDVKPTDWAFQVLQSLVERYDCIAGYPDSTYRGNQALTRYEFATGLNACLNRINELITAGTANFVTKDDLVTLQRLQEDFTAELTTLRGQIDNLEVQTTQLEANQFSTTTRLEGEVIFALGGAGGGKKADGSGEEIDQNVTLGNRVRLDFETSFTGEDELSFRLQARNTTRFDEATGTEMARLGFEGSGENKFELSEVAYRFPVGEQAMAYLYAVGGSLSDFTKELNPVIEDIDDTGTGSISRFGQQNPIYRQGGSTGVGLSYELDKAFGLSLGYVADEANNPEVGIGGGSYGAIAQLTFTPSDRFGIALSYVRSYNNLDTGTGSDLANDPFDGKSNNIIANSYGVDLGFQVSPTFALGGWLGFTQARANDLAKDPEATIFNYAVTLAFPNLGKDGNVAGIVIGQPPKVTNNDFEVSGREYEDEDTSFHLETFYLFQATDNIAITPGIVVIINPEHDGSNDTVYVGTIRTTFTF